MCKTGLCHAALSSLTETDKNCVVGLHCQPMAYFFLSIDHMIITLGNSCDLVQMMFPVQN